MRVGSEPSGAPLLYQQLVRAGRLTGLFYSTFCSIALGQRQIGAPLL
jgi:hypothetical protein